MLKLLPIMKGYTPEDKALTKVHLHKCFVGM